MNDNKDSFTFTPIGEHIYAKAIEIIDYKNSPVSIMRLKAIASYYEWAITDRIFYARLDKCLRFGQKDCYIVLAGDVIGYEEDEINYLSYLDNEYTLSPPLRINITPDTGPHHYVHIEEFKGFAGEGKTIKDATAKLRENILDKYKRLVEIRDRDDLRDLSSGEVNELIEFEKIIKRRE